MPIYLAYSQLCTIFAPSLTFNFFGMITIRQIKVGDFFAFTCKDGIASRVYVRGKFDRSSRSFSYWPFDDVNDEHFAKGSRKVYSSNDFEF